MWESRSGLPLGWKKNMKEVLFSTTPADLDSKEVSLEVLPSPSYEFKRWPGCIVIPSFSFCVSGFTPREIKECEMECARVSPCVRTWDAIYICILVPEPWSTCRLDSLNVALVSDLQSYTGQRQMNWTK